MCFFFRQWGIVYTLYDTVVDFYVTAMIAYSLNNHVRELRSAHTTGNRASYFIIIAQNVTRTTILTLGNLVTAILLFLHRRHVAIMVAWPVTNILLVLLIGYDTELSIVIQTIRRKFMAEQNPPAGLMRPPLDTGRGYSVLVDGRAAAVPPYPGLRLLPSRCIHCGRSYDPIQSFGGRERTAIRVPPRSTTPSFLATPQTLSPTRLSDITNSNRLSVSSIHDTDPEGFSHPILSIQSAPPISAVSSEWSDLKRKWTSKSI
ncbi:hypothetical protein BX666DRAFT_1846930 [Dichotomocladium elegans]|nr:hypothetical protein BX666DRAFT_1846930 [Dichotomocladium elegans]